MKPGIAFFDLDGTITKKDTLIEFIRYSKGTVSLYAGFLRNIHYLLGYKLKLISNQKAKEKILAYFFAGTCIEQFNMLCKNFAESILPQLLRSKAIQEIQSLQQKSIETVIVSASPENWVVYLAESLHMKTIATKLEISQQKITGKIAGYNCYGKEKVNRIKQIFHLQDYEDIYAYGDSKGDEPLLALAQFSYMKPFR